MAENYIKSWYHFYKAQTSKLNNILFRDAYTCDKTMYFQRVVNLKFKLVLPLEGRQDKTGKRHGGGCFNRSCSSL